MVRFRPAASGASLPLAGPDAIRRLLADVFRPAHFFVAPTLTVEWRHLEKEEIVWEVFQGRLLDSTHSRERRSFEAWGLYQLGEAGPADEPLLGLKWDVAEGRIHVVRGLDSYVWEGYDSGGNVYLSRERRKWVRELVGTMHLTNFADIHELRDELICELFRAVVGMRLPLSSVEAPLPAFSFGELFYCYRGPTEGVPSRQATEMVCGVLSADLAATEQARLLEVLLRATPVEGMASAARVFLVRWRELGRTIPDLLALLRKLFNEVSLSPDTGLAERLLTFLQAGEEEALGAEEVLDFEGLLLRQLGRHLTAYDLVTFHHRGANYPDALLLDALLKDYLARIEASPDLCLEGAEGVLRLRRRALRQGWLLRRRYEGHTVPDLPTSPGENSRVLPTSHPRVPEEQLSQPGRRQRRLYESDPLQLGARAAEVLRQSALDLDHPDERRELGAALFLDRPFGGGKAPAEPDATLLLASLAYSRAIAEQRLRTLANDLGLPDEQVQRWRDGPVFPGLPLEAIGGAIKPATVSLSDARRAAPDFVFLHTLPGSVRALREQFERGGIGGLGDSDALLLSSRVLIARSLTGPGVIVYDEALRPRLEIEPVLTSGYVKRAGEEWPVAGWRVVKFPLPR